MKKMICIFLAAVLVVVMMAPMEVRASAEEESNFDPELLSIIENSQDPVSDLQSYAEDTLSSDVGTLIEPRFGKGYNPFTLFNNDLTISSFTYDENSTGIDFVSSVGAYGLLQHRASIQSDFYFDNLEAGYYQFSGIFMATLKVYVQNDLAPRSSDDLIVSNRLQTEITYHDLGGFALYLVPQTGGKFVAKSTDPIKSGYVYFYMIVQGTGEPVYINPSDRAFTFPGYIYCNQNIELYSSDLSLALDPSLNELSIKDREQSIGVSNLYYTKINHSGIVSAIEGVGGSIISGISGLGDRIGNWFQTQWTFGRQWTDDIIDAIVGQSGGGGISSAQDELDDQLNSIEVVEQQLSDQVVDKIEVPSVSLNADETGGLRWVITTINSLYLSFNELHVMFACVVFFGIVAVLLFGRRNL